MTEADLKAGLIITCKSTGKDKFKLVFFDQEGHVTMVQESQQNKRCSAADLYVVPYGKRFLYLTFNYLIFTIQEDTILWSQCHFQ